MTRITLALIALTIASGASAQQSPSTTIYNGGGKVIGHSTTDSQGSTTIRDAQGRTTGRTSTDSQGTTTIYDASGKVIGKETRPPR